MGRAAASVSQRIVARVMRNARRKAGITATQAASVAGLAQGTLTKYEKAENPFPKSVVYLLGDHYGLSATERDALVALSTHKTPNWWHVYHDIPDWFQAYVGLETEAHTVLNYEDGLVPGLLQTPDYARAVLAADIDAGTSEQIDTHVTVRMRRQQRLSDPDSPLALHAVVNESALHRHVGGPTVLRDQLQSLLTRSEMETVTLQILPFEAGAHAASEGSFAIMRFPDLLEGVTFGDVVLVEYRIGALYLENEHETDAFARVFSRLQETALTPQDSTKRIQQLLEERHER